MVEHLVDDLSEKGYHLLFERTFENDRSPTKNRAATEIDMLQSFDSFDSNQSC